MHRHIDARVSGGPFRRQPDSDRHPRLPRRARRRARRDLRRPLAGADRGARRDDRAADADLRRRSARAGRLLGQPGVHLHRRVRVLDDPQPARAHSAGGDHRHLLRRRVGGRDSGDEQGDVGERAPQGHARRQHPRGVVAGGRRRRRVLYGAIGAVPLHLPPQVPRDLDESRARRERRA